MQVIQGDGSECTFLGRHRPRRNFLRKGEGSDYIVAQGQGVHRDELVAKGSSVGDVIGFIFGELTAQAVQDAACDGRLAAEHIGGSQHPAGLQAYIPGFLQAVHTRKIRGSGNRKSVETVGFVQIREETVAGQTEHLAHLLLVVLPTPDHAGVHLEALPGGFRKELTGH